MPSILRLAAAAAAAIVLATAGCDGRHAPVAGPTEITVWQPFGQDEARALQRVIDRYDAAQNRVRVRLVFTPSDLSTNQKFFTAVAANKPPDATFVDGTQVAQWAEWGALTPLDTYAARDHVREGDFYPPCWKQSLYQGHIWALTYGADPNFAFGWNKRMFRQAGLDPNQAPRTIAEVDAADARLTRVVDGRVEALGIVPWSQYGNANSLFTWGWAFGGSFYDERRQRITANDPRIVQALEWMVRYARLHDITQINSATSGWGSGASDPFITGRLAMRCLHITALRDLRKYAPDLDYGISPMPGPPGGETGTSWIGGWLLAIPRGSAHPDAAWDFVHWMCDTPEGTTAVVEETGNLPGYRRSPGLDAVRRDPRKQIFLHILETSRHQRPVMPAQAFFMGALDRAVDRAVYGRQTAKETLDQATEETQRELDLILGRSAT